MAASRKPRALPRSSFHFLSSPRFEGWGSSRTMTPRRARRDVQESDGERSSSDGAGRSLRTPQSRRKYRSGGPSFSPLPPNPNLRGHLTTRQHKNRDPMLYYDSLDLLGMGSMGSVSRVVKKESALGGSSRASFVIRNRDDGCFSVPVIGMILKAMRLAKRSEEILDVKRMSQQSKLQSNTQYALKTIHLRCVRHPEYVSEMKNEINLLKQLDHPNIVRAVETFDYHDQLCMVLELCSGGDLHSRDPYTESDACRIVCSILSAVEYMHGKGVTHRDLKYENIMFTSSRPDADVKIIDFGLSEKYGHSGNNGRRGVGTVFTMAPEAFSGLHTPKSDVWSVGVIAFMLLSSQIPFYAREKEGVVRKILLCKYKMKEKSWGGVSDPARDFVRGLLKVDPKERPSTRMALQHTWLNTVLRERSHATEEVLEDVFAAMCRYAGYGTLKKLALMVISHKSTSADIGPLRGVFHRLDVNRNGHITFEEFSEGFSSYGYDQEELMRMFHGADLDGTGVLRYTEFLAATIEARGFIGEECLAESFDRLDDDDTGYISTENLCQILDYLPGDNLNEVIKEVDLTHDGKISYREFLAMWKDGEGEESNRITLPDSIQKQRMSHCDTTTTESVSSGDSMSSASQPGSVEELSSCV